MLNLIHLRTLVTVLEQGSFVDAARQLGLAQPTVSQHIRKLEQQLGIQLINRHQSDQLATAAAMKIVDLARQLQSLHDRVVQQARHEQLTVAASSNIGIYYLQPLLQQFRRDHADTNIVVNIEPNPVVKQRLDNGLADLALMEWWDQTPGYQYCAWRQEELVVIVPPDHLWATRRRIQPRDLAGIPLLAGEPGTGTGRLLREYLAGARIEPCIGMTLGSTEAVKQAVMNGLGISLVLAGTVIEAVAAKRLCAIPLAYGGLQKSFHAVWPERNERLSVHQAFRTLLQPEAAGATAN
ncbi:MAG: LysR family transcriptional regulator [Gammaproteobacteria bacterium]